MDNKNVTSLARVERMINRIKKDNPLINNWENYELSFEFICASLFPKCYENIERTMNNCYTEGYLQGLEESKNDSKRYCG